jgi:hypothetical protein
MPRITPRQIISTISAITATPEVLRVVSRLVAVEVQNVSTSRASTHTKSSVMKTRAAIWVATQELETATGL